jgi:hypothetical protein
MILAFWEALQAPTLRCAPQGTCQILELDNNLKILSIGLGGGPSAISLTSLAPLLWAACQKPKQRGGSVKAERNPRPTFRDRHRWSLGCKGRIAFAKYVLGEWLTFLAIHEHASTISAKEVKEVPDRKKIGASLNHLPAARLGAGSSIPQEQG